MRVLLFTHKNDIDGMGNAVLAQLAYKNVDYELCGTFDLTARVESYFASGKIYEYDKILITDLCPNKEYLSKLKKFNNVLLASSSILDEYIENNPIEKENIYTSAPDPMDRASMQVESENNTTLVVNGYTESDVNRMVEDIETKSEEDFAKLLKNSCQT